MYDMFTELVRGFAYIDGDSLAILMVMIGWSALLLHLGLESRMFTALFVPGMFLGGLLAFYLARLGYLHLFGPKEMQAIAVSVVGIVVGFLVTVIVVQVVLWLSDRVRRPVTIEERK